MTPYRNNRIDRKAKILLSLVGLFALILFGSIIRDFHLEQGKIKIPSQEYKEFYELHQEIKTYDNKIERHGGFLKNLKSSEARRRVLGKIKKLKSERNSLTREYNEKVREEDMEEKIEKINLPYPIEEIETFSPN